jgi:hypothetical protein
VCTIKADAKEPVRNRAGIRVSHRATWISVFLREATARWSRIGNSGIVGESELPAQSGPLGATTYSENDDKALGERSAGTNAGHGGGLLLHLVVCRTTYARVLERVRPPGTGTLQACQESIQPKAMWAPAPVPPPLIGRHRSTCSWDVPVTPSNGVSRNACNTSVNGDQPY